ncbi:MAG: globin domain-containing protein [Waterburya sp.]
MENQKISATTRAIVKSTAPILKHRGREITTRMYEIMFEKYPEIQKKFDLSAQADGSQPVKLAQAVYSYASQIDNLPALKSMVTTIANRHVQTNVLPEEYPIVGECLLQAMKDLLEHQATEEMIAAWQEAYQALSEIFIKTEQKFYQRSQ